jgi:hypothetical protein
MSKMMEDEVRALESKDAQARTETSSDEEEKIAELLKAHPELVSYIDRRVTEGIKTFAANQKKKTAEVPTPEETEADDTPESETDPAEIPEEDAAELQRQAVEAEKIKAGLALEGMLADRGLSAFAGLIQDPALLDDLAQAANDYLRMQNVGADFVPQKTPAPPVNLSPLEQHIAQRLGIKLEDYAVQKEKLGSRVQG